jgi:hypothetical protein
MPVARYFLFVGGVLLALLFGVNALVPQDDVVASNPSSPGFDKSTVRIRSTQKLPERVVYDTNLPTIVPAQVNAVAAAAPAPARDASAETRVRDTFAQFVPQAKSDPAGKAVVAEAKPAEQPAAVQAVHPVKKRRIARSRNPPAQYAQYGQPSPFQPYRVAQQQQQPRFGLFSGFGTW